MYFPWSSSSTRGSFRTPGSVDCRVRLPRVHLVLVGGLLSALHTRYRDLPSWAWRDEPLDKTLYPGKTERELSPSCCYISLCLSLPLSVCPCLSVALPLSSSPWLSISISLFIYMSLSLLISVFPSVSLSLPPSLCSLSLSPSLSSLTLCTSVSSLP